MLTLDFETTFARAPVGVALLDLDGRYMRANEAFCGLTGFSEEELEGRGFEEITHPDDRGVDLAPTGDLLAGRAGSYELEKRYIRSDGRTIWVSLAVSLVRDADGEPHHYIAHAQDITARRRMERDLEDAARGFQLASDLLCTATFDGYLIRLNGTWQEVLGWSEDELRSRRFFEFVHPDDRDRTLEMTRTFERGGESRFFRNRWRHRDGSHRWLEWNAVGIPSEERVVCVAREVTDRVEIENDLALRGEIISNMAKGLCLVTVSDDPRIVFTNPMFERSLGFAPGELAGESAIRVFQPRDRTPEETVAVDEAADTLGREGSVQSEARLVKKDGDAVWMRLTTSTFAHSEHGPVWVVLCHDITEERLARTAWQEVERGRNRFYSSVSHELRTPLTSILGYAELLAKEGGLSAQGRDHVATVQRNARRQLRLVDDLLAVARAQAGDFVLERSVVDTAALVADAAEAMRPAAERAGLSLVVERARALPAFVDADRVSQVVANLVDNAIKHTPEGGTVRVSLARERTYVRLLVSDTGPGIAPQARDHVFDRLYRGDDEGGALPGAGLGLAICRAIADAHGGSIEIESTGPEGTTMAVRLPLAYGA